MHANFQQLLSMGGYGTYIWSAYALVLAGLSSLLFPALWRWKKYLHYQLKK